MSPSNTLSEKLNGLQNPSTKRGKLANVTLTKRIWQHHLFLKCCHEQCNLKVWWRNIKKWQSKSHCLFFLWQINRQSYPNVLPFLWKCNTYNMYDFFRLHHGFYVYFHDYTSDDHFHCFSVWIFPWFSQRQYDAHTMVNQSRTCSVMCPCEIWTLSNLIWGTSLHITSEMVFDFMNYYSLFHKIIVMILVIINKCFILCKFCINIPFSGYAVSPDLFPCTHLLTLIPFVHIWKSCDVLLFFSFHRCGNVNSAMKC